MIGALAGAGIGLPVTTAVTCPTVRIHPAVIAQAAATSQVLLDGRFTLGVGTGEALNEHILGDRWPEADVRLEMLEEAVEVMRALWERRFGQPPRRHYTVENARIYTLPDEPPPIYVSGFGPKAIERGGAHRRRLCHHDPGQGRDRALPPKAATSRCRRARRSASRPTEEEAVKTAHRIWPNDPARRAGSGPADPGTSNRPRSSSPRRW